MATAGLPVPREATAGDQTKLGLGVLGAALVLGILGDGLLRATPWGLNVGLWTLALVVAVGGLVRWRRIPLTGDGRWLVLPILLFAGAIAWRASPTLFVLNLLCLLVVLALAAVRTRFGRLWVAGLTDYGLGLLPATISALAGPLPLIFNDIRWSEIPRTGRSQRLAAVSRGLALAAPLVLVFGGLFVASDAAFASLVGRLFGWDLSDLIGHLFLIGWWAWLVSGYLRELLLGREWGNPIGGPPRAGSLGAIEVAIVLGALNLLFFAFVLVQFRYFFGGAALVETSATLTYAEYARRGFFELVTVAALVLPVLLVVDWLRRRETAWADYLFRGLAAALVTLLAIIMISAVQRMRLYQAEYGLTELRFYTTAFMGWLAIVFLWFLATVLRNRRERFAGGVLVSGLLAAAVLNALNPDALIARVNLDRIVLTQTDADRSPGPRAFDAYYLTSLSADAVPVLVEGFPAMNAQDQRVVARSLLDRWADTAAPDWRTWNWGRAQALRAIRANQREIESIAAQAGPTRGAQRGRFD